MKQVKEKNLLFFIPLLILNVISLFNMVNAKLISPTYSNVFFKQLVWFIIGYLIIFIFNKIKIDKLFKYSKYLYYFSCTLLILVLIFGKVTNGSRCWLNLFGFTFQPSELVKLTLILYLSNIINNAKINLLKDEITIILKLLFFTLIPSILVFLEPDTGAIINYLIIFIICLFFLRLNKWWYIVAFSCASILLTSFILLYLFSKDTLISLIGTSFFYRIDRLINFANGNSYQLEQSLINIGATTFFGVGFNKILLYIPEAPTDFFFAFTAGNFGLLSTFIILIAFLVFNLYLIFKTSKIKNKKYCLFTYSYIFILLFHEIYNIGMNIGLLPIMGIPLPFLSYGGSSIIINYCFLGIIFNIFNTTKKCCY